MFIDLNLRLEGIVKRKREWERLQGKLQALEEKIQRTNLLLLDSQKAMDKEREDVEELEKISPSSVLYTLLFKKEEKLKKEQKEYVEAKIKVAEATKELQQLLEEKKEILPILNDLQGIEKSYEDIIAEKEVFIKENKPHEYEGILRLSEEISLCRSKIKELKEAIEEGEEICYPLEQLEAALDNAEDWGVVDILGGGMISTYIKHEHIDEVRSYMAEIKNHLGRFQRELMDVNFGESLEFNKLDKFVSFADYFFDGFFVDFYVQATIDEAQEDTIKLKEKIQEIISSLYASLRKEEERLDSIIKQRIMLIEAL